MFDFIRLYNLIYMGLIFAKVNDESRVIKLGNDNPNCCDNRIDTAKYSLITFFPKSILLQFTRLSNVVFLANVVLQSIKIISTISPITAISPLAFVLSISLLRQGYQDYKRHKKDWEVNSRKCLVMRNQQFVQVQWDRIQVGQLVKIKSDEFIPSDLLLLSSSIEAGICYVETSNLDGENNLKEKFVVNELSNMVWEQFESSKAEIIVQKPTSNLYEFSGRIEHEGKDPVFVDYQNLLLRDTVLKNTQQIIGVTIYCGHDTKILKNQGNIHHKMSNIEHQINYIQVVLVILLILICASSSMGFSIIHSQYDLRSSNSYVPTYGFSLSFQSFLMFFTIFLLLNFLIPVTLNILIEGIKTFSGIFMSIDKKLYDKTLKKHCGVLNSSIVEQLGLVDCVLTDKTGTLTANQMIFRTIAIEGKIYSRENIQQNIQQLSKKQQFHSMMMGMILCHDVILDTKKEEYQGSSPDEVCFINFASQIGYKFISKTKNIIQVQMMGNRKRYELMDVIPFSSRKRMSVIVKNKRNKIVLYTKGADSAIFQKAHWYQQSQLFNSHIDGFAKQGLRTLVFSKKVLTARQLKDYLVEKESIKNGIRQHIFSKEETLLRETALIQQMQNSLQIIGATGIQDKLQQDVPQTLSRLQQADIKVMMITGDKLETAQNIGYLSHMIKQNYKVYKISADIANVPKYALFIRNQIIDSTPFTVMVQGKNITEMMQETEQDIIRSYISILSKAKSVIFCRSSPKQKATIVKFVKEKMKLTVLAIGDGGNDVGMIEQAHIGVGILGKQGNTAAAVSDFSFGKFKFLDRLILHHGRWFYYRLSYFFVFFGLKNMVITICIYLYLIDCAFSGTLIFTQLFYLLYNAFIGVSMMVNYGLWDQDINDDLQPLIWRYLPLLYKQTKKSNLFTYGRYAIWSFAGIIISGFIYYMIKFSLMDMAIIDENGHPADLISSQIAHGLALNLIILILNFVDTQTQNSFFIVFVFFVCSIVPTVSYFVAENYMRILQYFYGYSDNLNLRFALTILMITSVVYLSKVAFDCFRIQYFPTTIDLYKIAKNEDQENKQEIFQRLIKNRLLNKNKDKNYGHTYQLQEIKHWTSNCQSKNDEIQKVKKKYRSAAIKFNTEECLREQAI